MNLKLPSNETLLETGREENVGAGSTSLGKAARLAGCSGVNAGREPQAQAKHLGRVGMQREQGGVMANVFKFILYFLITVDIRYYFILVSAVQHSG